MLAPVNGRANGMTMPGMGISKEDARISVAFCAERMKNERNCSKQLIGVSKKNGQCWCAKANDNCEKFVEFASHILYFFQMKKASEEILAGGSEEVFEGAIEVGLHRRLNTKCMCMHAVL